MLVLYETSGGYAIFKVLDKKALKKVDKIEKKFSTPEGAQKIVSLKKFMRFDNQEEAMKAATAIVESKVGKSLKKLLKEVMKKKKTSLAVCDKVLAGKIKEKLGIKCVYDASVIELMRGIRNQITSLLEDSTNESDFQNMSLGLAHSLSRYKLKFSADKVDTMIVQAVSLLDDLDKELNIYAMRVKEWYGWHFPELAKIIVDNLLYSKVVMKLKDRFKIDFEALDLSDTLEDDLAAQVIDALKISMGTEISEEDILHICMLCKEVIGITEYRAKLYDYLTNRMRAIAPNLTHLVGELVGARLIAHSGSLLNLAKQPSSTVQLLGAEKALFRAIKSKQNTPKYGLIYNASFVGSAPAKHKGKIARVLAAKCSLSVRVDALGEKTETTIGITAKETVEHRLANLDNVAYQRSGNNGGSSYGRSGNNGASFGGQKRSYSNSNDYSGNKRGNWKKY